MSIYDCYRLRFNTSLGALEMNVGGEDWELVPTTTAEVLATPITGYVSGAGTVGATDTILEAINKLNGNTVLKLSLTGGALTGALTFTGTTFAFTPPKLTTTQRDALTPTAGMLIYNTSTNKLNVYTTGWEAITSA